MMIQEKFMQLLHARWGAFVQWAVGAIVGYAVAWAAEKGIPMPDAVRDLLTETLVLGFAFLATFVVQWYQSSQNRRLQRVIGTEDDGWIGEETIQAAKQL